MQMRDIKKVKHVYVLPRTHKKIMQIKRKEGGKNIPDVIDDLISSGIAYREILAQK